MIYIYDLRLEHNFGTRLIFGDNPNEISCY